jgi:tetratricopeptide (TPR) repeat protein
VRIHPALLGLAAGALLCVLGGTAWLTMLAPPADAAGEAVSPPPTPLARLAEGEAYDTCLAQLRENPEAARERAEVWEVSGGGEAARHCLGLALLALGDARRAAERLEALAARSGAAAAARAGVFAQAGQAWMAAGNAGRAYAATTMGLVLTPDDRELLLDRALALGAMGRNAEALADLDRVLALDPRHVEALVIRAAAMRRLDRAAEAERDVTRALALAPDNAEAFLERGILRQLRGDAAGARAEWERALALAPGSPTADLAQQNLALSEAGPARR